jgi:hypothetical protein
LLPVTLVRRDVGMLGAADVVADGTVDVVLDALFDDFSTSNEGL